MSYQYHYQGSPKNFVVLIPTKEAIENGCPKGVVIPLHEVTGNYLNIREYIEKDDNLRCYTAHHCDRINEFTHFGPAGQIVNRFGFYLTREVVLSVKKNWVKDIEKGWFKLKKLNNLDELDALLSESEAA